MKLNNIPVPSEYKKSQDFRFFIKWFDYALTKIQYDTANMVDLYDALRCPKDLLWMLGDTIGYQYDDRLCAAFNRFVILYFMSMIKYKGSQLGVTLAAEVNLKQKDINAYGEENEILYNRLDDTSIPNNSVSVESNVEAGYINVVYFTNEKPVDACIEYVRPLGMYCFQYAGVKIDSNTKISVDARLANAGDATGIIGPTKVGHYSRNDYARLQKMRNEGYYSGMEHRYTEDPVTHEKIIDPSYAIPEIHPILNTLDTRRPVYARNSKIESAPMVNAGYRALSSLQMSNNEHLVKSLFSKPIFNIGYGPRLDPESVDTIIDTNINDPKYNLKYNKTVEQNLNPAIYTLDPERQSTPVDPKPKVNNIMSNVGDVMDT